MCPRKVPKVPDVVVRRLPIYLRALERLDLEIMPIVSSEDIAQLVGTSSGQVRKDLSYFGVFGKQGVGYRVAVLRKELRGIMKLNREIKIGLIGAGNLGGALVRYHQKSQAHHPIEIVAIFDVDEKKIGKKIADVEIFDLCQLVPKIKELEIKLMIMAFPAENAQRILDQCVENGVKTFLSFVPVALKVPEGVKLQTSDVTLELQSLVYYT